MFKRIAIDLKIPEAETTGHGRFYRTPEGNLYPSVTTVMSHASKESIKAWRERVGEEEANKISNQAATRGTKIHDLCENVLLNNDIDTNNLSLLDKQMWDRFCPAVLDPLILNNIHALEDPLYSDHLRMAGRVDCIAEWEGKLSVIDFKTSRKSKKKEWIDNYFMQCTSYAIMFEEMTGIPVPQIVVAIAVEDEFPQVFVEKRDNYVTKLLDLRLDYERNLKL
jgi:genome maintenance exonuclease 1